MTCDGSCHCHGLAVQLAAVHGHHVPGTPYTYRHGWQRISGSDTVRYHGSLGIDRADMPQLSGTVRGEYQGSKIMQPKFIEHLAARGIPVTRERVPASSLQPTQSTGDLRVIKGIAGNVAAGHQTKPIFISADDRVMDGHHTWAARQLAAEETGDPGLGTMDVVRVGLPIDELLGQAHEFGRVQGIKRRATGQVANPQYGHRVAPISGQVAEAEADSIGKYRRPDGSWEPARLALHDQIVAAALAGHQREEHPVATFLGGGTASGKSTAFPPGAHNDVHIDSDAIKAQLPDYQDMTAAGDPQAAAYVHEESSHLAKRIKAAAETRGFSYTFDGTGDASYTKMRSKIDAARAAGHQVVGKFVTVDTDEAIRRSDKRAAQTGRFVPHTVIRGIHAGVSRTFRQMAANNDFDLVELYDTNGPSPLLVGHTEQGGSWTVLDAAAWRRFLAKEGE